MPPVTDPSGWAELAAGSRAITTKLLDVAALPSGWAQVKTTEPSQ
jgi:endoglucanase